MWVSTAGRVAASIDEVVGSRSCGSSLERWLPVLTVTSGAVGDDDGDGLRVGDRGDAALALHPGSHVPVRWRVVRRVRDTVHVEVIDAAGDRLELRASYSPWHGGTAVELGVEGRRIGGRRLRGRAVARRLDRAIAAIEERTSAPAPPRVRRTAAATRRLRPGDEAAVQPLG